MAYNLYSEPLLHPHLADIISAVSRRLPAVNQILFTNGDFLTDEIHKTLLENGLARFILTSHDRRPIKERPKQIVLFPEDLDLTNRGGLMSYLGTMPRLEKPLPIPCYAPSMRLILTVTGDAILCCEDARRTQVMGNFMQNSIEDVWFSERFEFLRRRLAKGDRGTLSICGLKNHRGQV